MGEDRVVKYGSFQHNRYWSRSARRQHKAPDRRMIDRGARLVRIGPKTTTGVSPDTSWTEPWPFPVPPADLVARAERIAVVQPMGSECFLLGGKGLNRVDLRVLWDITEAAGRSPEPSFGSREIAVYRVTTCSVTYVNEDGKTVTADVLTGGRDARLKKDAIEIVYLGRHEGSFWGTLVGSWGFMGGEGGAIILSGFVQPYTKKVVFEEDWHSLVHYSTEVLKLLGVAPEQARALTLQNLQALDPRDETAVDRATWGEVKARVRGR